MTIGNAIFQGIVQGLTEFLPVSSSGHLALVQYFTGQGGGANGIFYTVVLHLGTLIAVFIAFWKTIAELIFEFLRMLVDIFTGRFTFKNVNPKRRMIFLLMLSLFPLVFVFIFRDWVTRVAASENLFLVGTLFLITSALIFLSDRCVKGHKTAKDMRKFDAVAIGVTQVFATMPGISRSGSTISMGLILGLEKKYAVAFSFIIGIPPVMAANVLELGDAMREGVDIPLAAIIVGVLVSLVVGILAIKMLRYMVVSDKFKYFAWYTLVLGTLVLIAAVIEQATGGFLRNTVMALIG